MNTQEMQQRMRQLRNLLACESKVKQIVEDYARFLEGEDRLRSLPVRNDDAEPAPRHLDGWRRVRTILQRASA